MLTLSGGLLSEDFDYGDPASEPVPVRPAEFDFAGRVYTNAGTVDCPQQTFLMCQGTGASNPDAALPYGGPPSSNPSYLRFPTLGWSGAAGMFLTVVTTATATLTFDRAFSGYVGDRFSVVLNGVERITITGSAGYGWTRSTLLLPRGTNTLAFVLKTADYTGTGFVREGTAQSSATIQQVYRFMRLTNLSITNVAALPTATNQQGNLIVSSTMTAVAQTRVPAKLSIVGQSWLIYSIHSGPVSFAADANVDTSKVFIGKFGQATCAGDSNFGSAFTLGTHHYSDTGGFAIRALANLSVDSVVPLQSMGAIRPIKKVSVAMTRPTITAGTPGTALAECTTEVITQCNSAQYVRRVDPHSPANTVPVTPTWRWLSLDAESDPLTDQVTEWHPTYYPGPVWSTPGDYRPSVGRFTIKIDGREQAVRYPSVQFDAAHLDHLVTTLPQGTVDSSGVMTWVFVGAFCRFRGAQADNCPILDYNALQAVNYFPDHEAVADRGVYLPWTDEANASSIYLGLTGHSDKDQTSSRFCYRTSDAATSFARTDALAISDATAVVLIYRLNRTTGTISVTPLVAGQASSTQTSFTRTAVDGAVRDFALGKSRIAPPFGGSFLTGSMSLLEVGFFNRAITDAEIAQLQQFYLSLYSPVAGGVAEPDYTVGSVNVTAEQVLLYAADPETELVYLTGNKAVNLGVFPSTTEGRVEMDRFNAQGVPVIQVTNRDYSNLLLFMDGDA